MNRWLFLLPFLYAIIYSLKRKFYFMDILLFFLLHILCFFPFLQCRKNSNCCLKQYQGSTYWTRHLPKLVDQVLYTYATKLFDHSPEKLFHASLFLLWKLYTETTWYYDVFLFKIYTNHAVDSICLILFKSIQISNPK